MNKMILSIWLKDFNKTKHINHTSIIQEHNKYLRILDL